MFHHLTPLSHSLHASQAVISAVLATRARAGDDFLALARSSSATFDLSSVVRYAPLPRLNLPPHPTAHFDPAYHAALYRSALRPLPTVFDAETPPSVSIHDYVERIVTYGCVSNVVFLSAMLLVDRLCSTSPSMILTTYNIHRVFIAAFVIATKFHEDSYFANTFFSTLAGVSTPEINALEMAMLKMLNFRAAISVEQLEDAETVFMSEAFDSSWGLTVYQTLRQENIAALDQAVAASTTWNTYEKVQDHAGTTSMKLVSGPDTLQLPPLNIPDQLHPAIHTLAFVQAEADFPNVDVLAPVDPAPTLLPLYSDKALVRFQSLRALAMGNVADTCLPPLERRRCRFGWSPPQDRPMSNTDWSYRANDHVQSEVTATHDWRAEWGNWQQAAPQSAWQHDGKGLPSDTWAPAPAQVPDCHSQQRAEWPKTEWPRPNAEWAYKPAWPVQPQWSPPCDNNVQQADWAPQAADWSHIKPDWAPQADWQPKSDWVVQAKNEWAAQSKIEWAPSKPEWQPKADWNAQQEWTRPGVGSGVGVDWGAQTDWHMQSSVDPAMSTEWPQHTAPDCGGERASWPYQTRSDYQGDRSAWSHERTSWSQNEQPVGSADVSMLPAPTVAAPSLNVSRDHFGAAKGVGVAPTCDKPYPGNVPFSFFENSGQYV